MNERGRITTAIPLFQAFLSSDLRLYEYSNRFSRMEVMRHARGRRGEAGTQYLESRFGVRQQQPLLSIRVNARGAIAFDRQPFAHL
jgi:hypothetical protein